MSATRLLLCVDGSPVCLAVARCAVEAARTIGGQVLALYVVADDPSGATTAAGPEAAERLGRSGAATLEFVRRLAGDAGVVAETRLAHGEVVGTILDEASAWHPDVLVLGRSGRHGPGSSMLGSVTEQVLEFAEVPVLVVPGAAV